MPRSTTDHRSDVTRRAFLASLGAMAVSPSVLAQAGRPPIPVTSINHMTLSVTDIGRSLEFYQALFGMPISARQASTLVLQVGEGPQFIALGGGTVNGKPGISHLCLSTPGFDDARVVSILGEHGVTPIEPGGQGLSGGSMKVRVRMRGAEFGGDPFGTPELYVGDPDGVVVQLQDPSYCGGAGPLGECLTRPEPSPRAGAFRVRDYNHFTIFVSDAERSVAFYQRLFGMPIDTYQGNLPLLRIGSGNQFLALAARGQEPAINHACLTIDDFEPDRVLAVLEEHGIRYRDAATPPVGPMASYVSMRMEDRGGAPGGTPELYFTDPDGIAIQLQATGYCGGSGFLGDVCG